MRTCLTLALLIACTLPVNSQDNDKRQTGSRLEALKIAYLTKKLDLSPDEAQQFWPVYNDYSREMRETRIAQRKNKAPVLENEEKMLQLRKDYKTRFSKVLSPDKVNTFFKAEKEFGAYVQKELAERRQNQQQRNRGHH